MSLDLAATSTSPTRERARAIITAMLGFTPRPGQPLTDIAGAGVDALIALERAFGIEIDVDEVVGADIEAVLDLVEAREAGGGGTFYFRNTVWDHERGVFLFPSARGEPRADALIRDLRTDKAALCVASDGRRRTRGRFLTRRAWARLAELALAVLVVAAAVAIGRRG